MNKSTSNLKLLSISKKIFIKNKRKINFLFTIFIILYFYLNVDFEFFFSQLKKIPAVSFALIILVLLPSPCLLILKWYLIVKSNIKKKFFYLYEKISTGIVVSELTQNNLVLDIYKFIYLNNLEVKKKIYYILLEKFLTLSVRLVYILILLNIFEFFDLLNIKKDLLLLANISVILISALFFLLILIKFFPSKKSLVSIFLSNIAFSLKKNKFSIFILFLLETIKNVILSLAYYISFSIFFDNSTSLTFVLMGLIIEILLRIQFFSATGFREYFIYLFGSSIIDQKDTVLVATIFVTFSMLISNLTNYFFLRLFKNFKKL